MILGQSAPAATTNTTVYTVPSGKIAIISGIFISNRGNNAVTIRLAVVPSGTLDNQHYLLYGYNIPSGNAFQGFKGLAMQAGAYIVIYASNANSSITVTGVEI